jgi:hypothetical protein
LHSESGISQTVTGRRWILKRLVSLHVNNGNLMRFFPLTTSVIQIISLDSRICPAPLRALKLQFQV